MSQSTTVAKAPAANSHQHMPFWKQLVAGGSAGIVEILCMYPTDVMKTRAQLSKEKLSILDITRNIIKNEGFGAFYRGIASPILAEAPKRAVKFSCNETYKSLFLDKNGHLPNSGAVKAGAMAGMTEAFINCPFEVIKVRMQAPGSSTMYKSTFDCFGKILKNEGLFKGLYRGFEPQLWRNAVWNGCYFGVIGTFRNLFPVSPTATKTEKVLNSLFVGSLGGALASCLNTPIDVVKSRMQNQPAGQTKYNWTWPSLYTILKEEGPRNLYKGLGPRLLRLGPGGGIMIVMFDFVSDLLKKY